MVAILVMIFTGLAAVAAFLTYRLQRRKYPSSRNLLRPVGVADFDPADVVAGYQAASVSVYLPITKDEQIRLALIPRNSVLIAGRGGLGKSHSVVHHIKQAFPNWYLLRPTETSLSYCDTLKIQRRSHVVLIDDLHRFLKGSSDESPARLTILLARIRKHSKECCTIATIRTTSPELDVLSDNPELLKDWQLIELDDWSVQQGQELEALTHVGMAHWDCTPRSVKEPKQEMLLRYRRAGLAEQSLLQCTKLLQELGIPNPARTLLRDVFECGLVSSEPALFATALEGIIRAGFLKPSQLFCEAYEQPLESVPGIAMTREVVDTLRDVLGRKKHHEPLVRLANYYLREKDTDQAEQVLQTVIQMAPNFALAWYKHGLLLAGSGRWAEAETALKKAQQLGRDSYSTWVALRAVYKAQGKTQEERRALAHVRLFASDSPMKIQLAQVEVLREEGRFEEALSEIDEVLGTNPSLPSAHHARGRVLQSLGRWQEADQAYGEAIRHGPRLGQAYLDRAEVRNHLGDATGALDLLRTAIQSNPYKLSLFIRSTQLLLHRKEYVEAEGILLAAAQRFRYSSAVQSYLAEALRRQGRWSEMRDAAQRAINLDESRPEGYIGLICAFRGLKQPDNALAVAEQALAALGDNPEIFAEMGRCYGMKKQWLDETGCLRKATALRSGKQVFHFELAYALVRIPRSQLDSVKYLDAAYEALEEFRTALRLGYRGPMPHFEMAKVFCGLDRLDEAMESVRAAVDQGIAATYLQDPFLKKLRGNLEFELLISALVTTPDSEPPDDTALPETRERGRSGSGIDEIVAEGEAP